MTTASPATTLSSLDEPTRRLVRVAAIVASGAEVEVREALAEAEQSVPHAWIEELLLQTYLFAGFPRALNAFREWRRRVPVPPAAEAPDLDVAGWEARGRETCRAVYGAMYDKLRLNIDALHPALDSWMIVEGYGKVLSRPALDLSRRELCIVAACAASRQERQLHSHLHGALHAGASESAITDTLGAVASLVSPDEAAKHRMLWARVQGAADVH